MATQKKREKGDERRKYNGNGRTKSAKKKGGNRKRTLLHLISQNGPRTQ